MIEIKEVTKRFDGAAALDNVTLTVPTGSIYGLVGPNGAGKSTLISHVAGIYRPDQGSVLIDGAPVFDNVAVRERIVSIYEDVYYYMSATTRDMMRLLRGVYPRFDMKRYEKLGEAFPDVDERTPLRRLSRGMAKQSAFRLALSCLPDVLLLDEPVDGLDPVMRRRMWQIMAADVADRGMTVLLSSHNLRELEDVCDRVGILDKGRVVLERGMDELQDGACKVHVLFEGEPPAMPAELQVLHEEGMGRMRTYVVRLGAEEARRRMEALGADYIEVAPLSLEEVFIYELGGADNVADIIL